METYRGQEGPETPICLHVGREYVQRRSAAAEVDDALHVLIPRYAGLLERLGNA